MVVPRNFLAAPLPDGPAIVMPKANVPNRRAKRRNDRPHAQAGGSGPVCLKTQVDPKRIDLALACPSTPPQGLNPPRVQRTMRSTPQRNNFRSRLCGPFSSPSGGPHFCVPEPLKAGPQALPPRPQPRWRSEQFRSPFGSDRRDPNTLAPNRSKARTTPLRPSRISASS